MPKILIVDDEWLMRLEIEELLNELGYEVAGQAETGEEAIAMARELNPDLILMDVVMPGGMNGIDAARVIKAELGIPIVFISGYGDPEYIEAAKEIAPFGYVMKPFDVQEVHAFVEIALSKRELELKLEKAHDELERRVESRTAELRKANKQLQEENEARKRSEEALRESEEHLRSFMESAKGFIVYRLEVDPENYFSGRLIFVSPGIEDEIGVSPEAEFSEWFNNVHPDDLPGLIEAQAKSVQNGDTFDREFRWKNIMGGWGWCHSISNPVFDSNGKLKYYNGIVINITAQKQAEKALQESEKDLKGKGIRLEELNISLKILLEKRDEDKEELEEKVIANVKEMVLPYVAKLKSTGLGALQETFTDIIESNLDAIISPFLKKLSSKYLNLTPTELRVADLVKHGLSTKEIGNLLNSSPETITGHRKSIRKKLQLKDKKSNLRTHLLSLQ